MIGFLLRGGLRMLALAGVLYVAFFVSLGEHTLYEHGSRIAGTREAQQLGGELKAVLGGLVDRTQEALGGLASTAPASGAQR